MDIFLILICVVMLWGLRPTKYNEGYIGRETTIAIKGIFAILILFGHSRQYLPPPTENSCISMDCCVISESVLSWFGQLIVVMFLTYSGYGIMEAFKRKRKQYLNGFLKKRVLKTLVHFDLAVLLFMLLALILGHEYPAASWMWSWTGWTSVGNSNWFVFDIIVLYLLSYFGLIIVERKGLNEKHFLWIIFGLSCCFLLFMLKNKQLWWYDTILAFPAGMLWSVYRDRIEAICSKPTRYWISIAITLAVFAGCLYAGRNYKSAFLFLASPLFGILVIMITMKLRIGNPVLNWIGINAFSIYILQRLSMIVASEADLNENPFIFLLITIPATMIIAWGFTLFTNRIDRKFFS